MAATQPVSDPEGPTYPANVTFDQLIAGVKQSEHQFQNVHVKDFETTTETLPLGQTKWIPSRIRYAGSAWYDGEAGGKQRIYFSDWVLPWVKWSGTIRGINPGILAGMAKKGGS